MCQWVHVIGDTCTMPTDIHKALSSLQPIEWKKLLVRIARKHGYLQQRGGPSPEDLLQTACEQLLSGRRNYPDGHDSPEGLCRVLWHVVKSLANHENDGRRRALEIAVVELDEDARPEAVETRDPGQEVSEMDVAAFRASLADDPRLQIVLDGKIQGDDQQEIAAQLQLSDAGVTKLKKKLQSRCVRFFEGQ